MRSFVGKVVKRTFARGSKSEHQAVFLQTGRDEYVLRILDGNPFQDPRLDRLVGKKIRCRGEPTDHTLIISDWDEMAEN
jgi:hypothetical protein